MKKVLAIGAHGQLGQYLCEFLRESINSIELFEISREELDLANIALITIILEKYSPDLLINASAYTAVDQAESEPDLAILINSEAPRVMAEYAHKANIPFIHYSTDYVFSGDASSPYKEKDATDPQGQYGLSKLAGEQALIASEAQVYIFRTAWVYSQRGSNFYKTMLKLAQTRDELNIVSDQVGSPTYAASIAQASIKVVRCLLSGKYYPTGVYHMTCQGMTTWADFAKMIFQENKCQVQVNGIPSGDYPTPAKRPSYSVLSNQKLKTVFNIELPTWQESLKQCIQEKMYSEKIAIKKRLEK